MDHNVLKQITFLEKQEEAFFIKSETSLLKNKITPVMDKIEEKIPEKLGETLDKVFYKGFQLIFEKGRPYIEKTYNKEKIEMDFDVNNYALGKFSHKRYIKRLDRQSKQSKYFNSSLSALEGSVLGLLGIGIPDIPVFLSLMIKTIYEIGLSYGFSYEDEEEQAYILLLICTSVSTGTAQAKYNRELEGLSEKIDKNIPVEINKEEAIRNTSKVLSDTLLTSKFIQGIPLVGVFGGALNFTIVKKVSQLASIKYKKRYLKKKL